MGPIHTANIQRAINKRPTINVAIPTQMAVKLLLDAGRNMLIVMFSAPQMLPNNPLPSHNISAQGIINALFIRPPSLHYIRRIRSIFRINAVPVISPICRL